MIPEKKRSSSVLTQPSALDFFISKSHDTTDVALTGATWLFAFIFALQNLVGTHTKAFLNSSPHMVTWPLWGVLLVPMVQVGRRIYYRTAHMNSADLVLNLPAMYVRYWHDHLFNVTAYLLHFFWIYCLVFKTSRHHHGGWFRDVSTGVMVFLVPTIDTGMAVFYYLVVTARVALWKAAAVAAV